MQEVEGFWGGPYERGKYSTFEGVFDPDPTDKDSRKASVDYTLKMIHDSIEKRFQILPVSPEINKMAGPVQGNYHELWLKKLIKAIDPNDLADRGDFG